jgi:hypothetical protein
MKAWRDRKMVGQREDFAGMTHNVGEFTKAAARGQMPSMKDLRLVKNPISRLVERDPGKYPRFKNVIYRDCPCGETAHKYTGYDDAQKGMIFECRNCRRKTFNKPGWYVRARAREREGADRG